MTMIYLQRSRQPKRRNFWFGIFAALIIIALIISLQVFSPGSLDRVALSIGGPVASVYTSIKNNVTFTAAIFKSRKNLVEQNRELSDRLSDIEAEKVRFDSILKENQDLLNAYGRSPFARSAVIGNVISKPPQSPYDVLVVDVGSNDNVAVNNQVYGLGGIPVGRIIETTGTTAKIVLYSSIGEQNEFVHERTGATIPVVGTGGGNMEAIVAQEVDIIEGDKLTLPQFGGTVVASVVQVESTVTSSSKRVLFRLPINVFHLRWVEIIRAE